MLYICSVCIWTAAFKHALAQWAACLALCEQLLHLLAGQQCFAAAAALLLAGVPATPQHSSAMFILHDVQEENLN